MATIDVKDAGGNSVSIEKPLTPGRANATSSRPVVLSNEDLTVLQSLETKLEALKGFVDGVEALISTTNSTLTTLSGYVDGLEALAANPDRGLFFTVTASKTRPADTNAYAAGDAWSNSTSAPTALTFSNVVDANGKSGVIEGLVVTSSQNNATLALQGELWLFDTAPTAINDNAAFTITDAEMNTLVAKIPFNIDSTGNATSGAGGNSCQVIEGISASFTTVSSRNLTGLVKVLNAYAGVSAEVLTFRLKIRQID